MEKFSLNEVIELAIQIEKSGYEFYNTALKRSDLSKKAVELITHLRDEEIGHEAIFKNIRSNENLEKLGNTVEWQEAASYLKAISDSHIFSDPKASIKLATTSANEIEVIEYAIQFEKDTLLFFHSLHQKSSEPETKKVINKIIDEEISHVMQLIDIQKVLNN